MMEFKWLLLGQHLGDGFVMYSETYDYSGPLAAFVYKWLDIIFGSSRWVHIGISTLLVIIQASTLNSILLKYKAYSENNYLPAFLYVILISSTSDFFALSPQLMSLTFIILSLNQIFRRIGNEVVDEIFLYAGIFSGLATLIYLPSIVYFIAFFISFLLFSTAIFRRLVLFLYGSFVPLFVVVGYFFWQGSVNDFWQSYFVAGFLKPKIYFLLPNDLLLLSAVLIGTLIIALSVFFTERYTNFQQNMMWVMVFFIFAAFATLMLSPELSPADLLFFIPPAAFFLTHYFLGLKRRVVKSIVPMTIILSVLIYSWWAVKNVEGLVIKDSNAAVQKPEERLLLLGDDLKEYAGYRIAGPFIDPYLSKIKLEDLNYYRGASDMYDILMASEADVIKDNWEIAPLIFERFPALEKRYKMTKKGEYRKISN
jgi:hypothetical protein